MSFWIKLNVSFTCSLTHMCYFMSCMKYSTTVTDMKIKKEGDFTHYFQRCGGKKEQHLSQVVISEPSSIIIWSWVLWLNIVYTTGGVNTVQSVVQRNNNNTKTHKMENFILWHPPEDYIVHLWFAFKSFLWFRHFLKNIYFAYLRKWRTENGKWRLRQNVIGNIIGNFKCRRRR